MNYDYDYDYYDNDDFIRRNFNKTLNQAGNRGYNANYVTVNSNRNNNLLSNINKCVSTVGTVTSLAIIGYGLYKFYKHVYYPLKRQMESRPYVDKSKENERVMNGNISKNNIPRKTITLLRQPDGVYVEPQLVEQYKREHPDLYGIRELEKIQ